MLNIYTLERTNCRYCCLVATIPNYHQLISIERKTEIQMPPEIGSVKFSSLVLSRTNRIGHYQSGDAVTEEINKEAKRDLVGVPSDIQ